MVKNFIYNEMVKKRNDIFHKHTSLKGYYQTIFASQVSDSLALI